MNRSHSFAAPTTLAGFQVLLAMLVVLKDDEDPELRGLISFAIPYMRRSHC